MNATEVTYFKAFLLDQKSSILNKTNEFKSEQVSREHLAEEAEAAARELSLNLSIHLHERERLLLFQVERALSKLEEGSYGSCESCGEFIGANRLKARPFASLCLPCKEEQEENRNQIN